MHGNWYQKMKTNNNGIIETIRFREKWYDDFLEKLKNALITEKKLNAESKFLKKNLDKAKRDVKELQKELMVK